jgi:hypothetical protein
MSSHSTTCSSNIVDAAAWLQNHMCDWLAEISMDLDPTIPSMKPPQLLSPMEEDGPANSPEFLPPPVVFTGTPISQPNPLGPKTVWIENLDGTVTTQTLAIDTLAGGAGTPLPPKYFPPGKKLLKKAPLPEVSDLSIFNVLNIFHHCWFLSVDSLRAQALLAQKAEDRHFFWVEFTPQFHAHLVKSTVALVPQLIQKVKKVLFVFILELLNRKGPMAFFDLSKGNRWVTAAQKEKKHLVCKRNHASRCDHKDWLKKPSKAIPNGNARCVDESLYPTKLLSNTNALKQKE